MTSKTVVEGEKTPAKKPVALPVAAADKSAWKLVPAKPNRKPCHRCARSLPVTDFSTNAAHRDGKNDFCRGCAKAYSIERREARKAAGTLPAKKAPAPKPAKAKTRTPVARSTKATGGQPRAPRAPRPARTPVARVSGTTVEAVSA